MSNKSLDLRKCLMCATGPGTSGKSNFYRWLFSLPTYHRHLIIDTQREFDPEKYNVYRPDSLEYPEANEELNMALSRVLSWPRSVRPRFIHVADCANYVPGGSKSVGGTVMRIIQQNTHIHPGITFSVSARKPQNIEADLRDLADHFLIFGAKGKSTWRQLDEISEGTKELIEGKDEYQFVHVGPQGNQTLYESVPDMGGYDEI